MNNDLILNIIVSCLNYLEKNGYASFDFFDALTSPYLNKVRNNFLRRLIIQLNGRSLINFRPFLGIKKRIHTKTISDLLSIYSNLYVLKKKGEYLKKGEYFYNLLLQKRIELDSGIGWGLNFPYSSRFISSNELTPNLFNTINSCLALLDYYEVSQEKNIYMQINKILKFIFVELGIIEIDENQSWLRYYPGQRVPVYNVNALAALTFLRINNTFKHEIVKKKIIKSLINFLINGQNEDGSWYYSASKKGKWIDGFHSGYILESLSYLEKHKLVDNSVIVKGVNYFITHLINEEGIPKYYDSKLYPIEAQNCAQAIQTISKLIMLNNFKLKDLLKKVIYQTNKYLYNNNGYYYYKKTRFYTNKNIFFRWSQTPMILALIFAFKVLKNN